MITSDIKSKIDKIWAAFRTGGIPNPLDVIEQITYLLFVKRLEDLHILEEDKANRTKKPMADYLLSNETRASGVGRRSEMVRNVAGLFDRPEGYRARADPKSPSRVVAAERMYRFGDDRKPRGAVDQSPQPTDASRLPTNSVDELPEEASSACYPTCQPAGDELSSPAARSTRVDRREGSRCRRTESVLIGTNVLVRRAVTGTESDRDACEWARLWDS
ncbi:type I restriction-modification system subunit M N-terminal domain-containing protein [Rhodopirellula sallentina]|uniref:N6 adenine-specific DNA methyltransferase N-terminal domain-containing protein n=1 Tax=Rhodopirellula sallentina SM41 TaxID=1263870 RepID=M5U3I0_9BACT|nr:type I restriction-modification system subunit M N-terminal domain-containing protein [Rhodopirellula sallentina]EMI56012.1 hypothetical protein RSSM_02549 [Rhodopirellula sallentina SM41]